jgi:hypothetical protein
VGLYYKPMIERGGAHCICICARARRPTSTPGKAPYRRVFCIFPAHQIGTQWERLLDTSTRNESVELCQPFQGEKRMTSTLVLGLAMLTHERIGQLRSPIYD